MNSNISLWQRIRRSPYQSFIASIMVFLTLFVTAAFIFFFLATSAILSYFESKPQLTVFFKDSAQEEIVERLSDKLKSTGFATEIKFISKEEALAIYREQNKEDPLLLEMVTADILPSSLEVSVINPKYLAGLSEIIKNEEGVDEIIYQKDVVETLVVWTSTLRKTGLFFISILFLTTLFILLSAIGIKIALRKGEIDILKLVGATSWYIKKPFVMEGLTLGLSGGLLAWIFMSALLFYITPFLTGFLKGIDRLHFTLWDIKIIQIWPVNLSLVMFFAVLLIIQGLIIGFAGSIIAVNRYLKRS